MYFRLVRVNKEIHDKKEGECTLRQEQLDKGHDKRRREETRAKTNNEKKSEPWLSRRPEESGVNTYCDLMKAREV
jgi:hypothetical protein